MLNFSNVFLVVFPYISDAIWTSCYLVLSSCLTIVCGCPFMSFVGDILLYISCIVITLYFQLFLTIFTFVFCNSSDSLPIYIASLYWYRCPNLNIHFTTFPATNKSFKMRSKLYLICIGIVISILSFYLFSVVSWHSIIKLSKSDGAIGKKVGPELLKVGPD